MTRRPFRADISPVMITNRSLRFAFCALLLLAPLAALSAQEMMDSDEGFYITAAYSAALAGEREFLDQNNTVVAGTGLGFLGGRFGVGYRIAGFRPEVSVGYRSAMVDSLKATKIMKQTSGGLVDNANEYLKKADISGTITSIDVAANVYYDIDTGSELSPYIGVGGGMSQVSAKVDELTQVEVEHYNDSAWALSIQAAAGIGFAVMDELTITLGYRLIGTMEAQFSRFTTSTAKTGMTLNHNVELGLRLSL